MKRTAIGIGKLSHSCEIDRNAIKETLRKGLYVFCIPDLSELHSEDQIQSEIMKEIGIYAGNSTKELFFFEIK